MLIFLLVSNICGQTGPVYTLKDPRDTKIYTIVKIGDYWWMAENLDIGEIIPSESEMSDNGTIEKYCLYNDYRYCNIYGGLYQWNELMQYSTEESAQGICPEGWHIPSDGDWKILEACLGMSHSDVESFGLRGTTEGGALKMAGFHLWLEPNTGATNEVGFSLLPAGGRNPDGTTCCDGYWTDLWTSTLYEVNDSFPWYRQFFHDNSQIYRDLGHKPYGTSVRCIKNTPALYEMSSITDERDGKVYDIVRIGEQWWMAQNMNAGTMINDSVASSQNGYIEKYCQDNQEKGCDSYGGLYQWEEMMQYNLSDTNNPGITRGICPDGWHVPTEPEWDRLESFIAESGNEGMEATVLKSTSGWYEDGDGTDIYGFRGLPGGKLNAPPAGGFYPTDYYGFFWTATESGESFARSRYLQYTGPAIYHTGDEKGNAYSVRCIKDTYMPMGIDLLAPDTVCASQKFNITAEVNGGSGIYTYSWTSDPPGEYPGENTIGVAPVADTRYFLKVDDGEMIAKDSILITVNPMPLIDLTGPEEICAGEEDNTAYSTPDNPNYQYSWFADNGEITSTADISQIVVNWVSTAQTRSLNLVVTDKTTGCEAQQQISVEILPMPSVDIVGPEIVCAGENPKAYSSALNPDYQYNWHTDNGIITTAADINQITVDWGTVPGTKTLNLVVADKTTGCLTEEQIPVEIKPLPVFSISGPTELCSGEDPQTYSTLSNLNFHYDWSTDDGNITTASDINQIEVNWGTTTGNKTLNLNIVDHTTGCHSQKQITVDILASPGKPVIKLKGGFIFICIDSGMVYQWYHNGIPIQDATNQFFCARDVDYRDELIVVETSLDNGCKNRSEPYVFSSKSSAFNQDPEHHRVLMHPNPNNGLVTIEIFDDYTGLIDIQIINALGQVKRQIQVTKQSEADQNELDLKQLEPGIYFMIFKYGGYTEIQRIFINNVN
ncbi:MAG: T9SS type A sorting domain-containing protein [Bacteroidales bacterium]|nr:T9SS type A sorting domain-containing protein [Bacteroidales bacterium]